MDTDEHKAMNAELEVSLPPSGFQEYHYSIMMETKTVDFATMMKMYRNRINISKWLEFKPEWPEHSEIINKGK